MKESLLDIFLFASKNFHKWYGLLSALLLATVILLGLYKLFPEGDISSNYLYTTIGATCLAIFVGWLIHVFRYPKRSKKRLGLVVAVRSDNVEDAKYLREDFLLPFKRRVKELDLPFDVLDLKDHLSEQINTVDDARKVLKKTNAHFCLFGSVKRRKNGREGKKYIFTLTGVVVHKPISEAKKILLRKEFDSLLPHNLIFEEGIQFDAFDFRVNQAVATVDYITGRAALLSGDFGVAIQLHESLLASLEAGAQYPIDKKSLEKILAIAYEEKANFEAYNGQDFSQSIDRALRYNQNSYGSLLKKAIQQFNGGNGDPQAALQTIKTAEKNASGYHWLYSEAFLHFWMGNYKKALYCCKKLTKKSYSGEEVTIKEVLRFNEHLVTLHDVPQLHYWLGYLYYIKDKNPSASDPHFQKFIDDADDAMPDLVTEANTYLQEIRNKIGY